MLTANRVAPEPAAPSLVSPETHRCRLPGPFELESGDRLRGAEIAYRTWGQLSPERDNAVVVCHALTGSADVDDWWPGLLGPGRALDPTKDFVVCSNILGSCYGTTGPSSPMPGSLRRWGPRFPAITIRDMVHLQARLLAHLGVRKVALVIGGSLGGMQTLEWALLYPELVRAIVPIAVSGRHSAWCIGLSEAQRFSITADPLWRDGDYPVDEPPRAGLSAARMVAMCTYRTRASFEAKFGRNRQNAGQFAIQSYLRYQGDKLVRRFDANAYLTLTHAMDSHDLGRGRGGYEQALRSLRQPALVVSVNSDVLYPPEEQRELVAGMPHATLGTIDSPDGHDAFLIETDRLNQLIGAFRGRASAGLEGESHV